MAYVLANWKMYLGPAEAIALFARVQQRLRQEAESALELPTVIVCPSAISLMAMRDIADGRSVALGAQNCHWEPGGPYTGEISAAMLAGLVDYVMVGHSERRRAGETDEQIARKVAAVAANAITPILFVGEDGPTSAAPSALRSASSAAWRRSMSPASRCWWSMSPRGRSAPTRRPLSTTCAQSSRA